MAPTQRDNDWESLGNDVDTIDLTLSSPEPEQRPRMPPRQSQLPSYFRREPRPYSMKNIKNEQGQRAGSVRNATRQQQARPISPRHLAQLINTTDSAGLKKVLLHLCQLSPALSGAVARGLAPYSTFAQEVMNQHGEPSAGRPGEPDTHSVYERMKRRVAARRKVTLDDPRLPGWVREAMQPMIKEARSAPRDASRKPQGRQSTPRAKREYPPDSSGSEPDKEHVHVPGAFPRSVQRANTTRTPLRDIPGSSSAPNNTAEPLSVAQRLAIIRREPKKEPRICAQCHEPFTDEDEVCMYHSGSKDKRGNIWSCCNRPIGDSGCIFGGVHIDPEKNGAVSAESGSGPEAQITLCTQCYELTGECTCSKYHSGRKIKREDGTVIYSCCNKPISDRGCEDGSHVDSERGYKRPSASPSPYASHQKKPRIL